MIVFCSFRLIFLPSCFPVFAFRIANEVTGSVFFRIFFQTFFTADVASLLLFFLQMNSVHILLPPRDDGPSLLKTDYFAMGI